MPQNCISHLTLERKFSDKTMLFKLGHISYVLDWNWNHANMYQYSLGVDLTWLTNISLEPTLQEHLTPKLSWSHATGVRPHDGEWAVSTGLPSDPPSSVLPSWPTVSRIEESWVFRRVKQRMGVFAKPLLSPFNSQATLLGFGVIYCQLGRYVVTLQCLQLFLCLLRKF